MSRYVRHNVGRTVLLFVVVLLSLMCVPCVAGASQTTTTFIAKVRVFQEYKVPVSGLQNTFEYSIEPVEADAPMPVDGDGKVYDSFSLTREEDMWLEFPVEVALDPSATPYVFHYMLKPKETELSDGLYYVDAFSTDLSAGINEYPLEIHVQPSSEDAASSLVVPTVHIKEFDGPKISDPGWRVSYKEPEDNSDDNEDKDKDKDKGSQANNQAGKSSSSGTSGPSSGGTSGSSSSSSKSPLSTTGDTLTASIVMLGIAGAGMSFLICASLLRRRVGEDRA